MNQESNVTSFIKSAILVVITGVVIWLTGFILILSTRLFYRFQCYPSFKEAFWTGLAAWWLAAMFLIPPSGQKLPQSTTNNQGYEYEAEGNKITFTKAPSPSDISFDGNEAPVNVLWKSQGNKPDLYAIGPVDGKNKVFTISTDPKVENLPEKLDLGENHCLNITIGLGKRAAQSAVYYSIQPRVFITILTILVLTMGAACFFNAQARVFLPAPVKT